MPTCSSTRSVDSAGRCHPAASSELDSSCCPHIHAVHTQTARRPQSPSASSLSLSYKAKGYKMMRHCGCCPPPPAGRMLLLLVLMACLALCWPPLVVAAGGWVMSQGGVWCEEADDRSTPGRWRIVVTFLVGWYMHAAISAPPALARPLHISTRAPSCLLLRCCRHS